MHACSTSIVWQAAVEVTQDLFRVYAKDEKVEETRCAIQVQAAEILSEEKEKVAEVRWLASKSMAEKMAETKENTAEVKRFTCCKMDDTE